MPDVGVAGGEAAVVDDMVVESVEDFLAFLQASVPPTSDYWFRGHQSDGWDLSASVFRTPTREANERILLKRFIQEARRHLPDVPTDQWDWVFLAQHHQVPTRLLDWSENPLVALFFAAQDHLDIPTDPQSARDGRVWMLQPTVMNSAHGFPFTGRDIPLFGQDDEFDGYRPWNTTGGHLQPLAGLAARNFNRIAAQWGTFTVCNAGAPLDLLPNHETFLQGVTVPIAAKSTVREQLSRLGYEDRTIYLDLFRLGQRLGEVYG